MNNPAIFIKKVALAIFLSLIIACAAIPSSSYAAVSSLSWSSVTGASTAGINDLTWSPDLNLFVAVGQSGTTSNEVETSPDGVTWTDSTANPIPEANRWHGVAWSHELGLFVAVANSGTHRVMTSTDGIHWTLPVATPPANNWLSVVWGSTAPNGSGGFGLFVAVSENTGLGRSVMTSPDGINWTTQTGSAITAANDWQKVTWSPALGLFAAISTTSGTTNDVMVSSDGITWTSASIPDAAYDNIIWSPDLGLFVAYGFNVTSVQTSTNGTTWTAHAAALPALNWQLGAWSQEHGIFVTVANTGLSSNETGISSDGASWALSVIPGTSGGNYRTTYSSTLGQFVTLRSGFTEGYISTVVAPTISSISSGSPATTSATITWTTDEKASSQVNYSTDTSYGSSTTLDSTLVFSHSVSVTGLTCGTTYNYKVSSTFIGHNTLSGSNSFSTAACPASAPTVTTSVASSITTTTATLNGNITATNGASDTSHGFNYGTTSGYGTTVTVGGTIGVASFGSAITGLAPNTVYHYQAFAVNTAGTGTSTPDATFRTRSRHVFFAPTVDVSAPTNITDTSATLSGVITDVGRPNPTARGFYYGPTTDYGTTTLETTTDQFMNGPFSAVVAGLACNTSYHVASYATNFSGTDTSGDVSFTTLPCSTGNVSGGSTVPASDGGTTTPIPPKQQPAFAFTHSLKKGVTESDVKILQQFLNTHGFVLIQSGAGSSSHETLFYGLLTAKALVRFQEANRTTILAPLGLTKGTGFFGPATMKLVNSILAAGK